jgi:hypothetical protein
MYSSMCSALAAAASITQLVQLLHLDPKNGAQPTNFVIAYVPPQNIAMPPTFF